MNVLLVSISYSFVNQKTAIVLKRTMSRLVIIENETNQLLSQLFLFQLVASLFGLELIHQAHYRVHLVVYFILLYLVVHCIYLMVGLQMYGKLLKMK